MNLEQLNKIQKVEVSPYLFTRIEAKIEESKKQVMPKKLVVAISLSFLLLIGFNILMLKNSNTSTNSVENYAESIHLTTSNSLYQ